MIKDTDTVKAICGSCGSRYTVQVSWMDSAVEFDCSCGARMRADIDDLFQIHHDMTAPSEITLHPLHEQREAITVVSAQCGDRKPHPLSCGIGHSPAARACL